MPDDLKAKVGSKLQEQPHLTWNRAVRLVVDPDAPEDKDEDGEQDVEAKLKQHGIRKVIPDCETLMRAQLFYRATPAWARRSSLIEELFGSDGRPRMSR